MRAPVRMYVGLRLAGQARAHFAMETLQVIHTYAQILSQVLLLFEGDHQRIYLVRFAIKSVEPQQKHSKLH